MITNQTIAQKELSQKVKDLKANFKAHLDGYIANVLSDLNQTVDLIISDYSITELDGIELEPEKHRIDISVKMLKTYLLDGKNALKGTIEEFWDHEGDSPFDKYEDLETELDKLEAEMDGQLKDDESELHADCYDSLKDAAEKYRLSDGQYYQDELIKILENEYNLVLIVAPAKNP